MAGQLGPAAECAIPFMLKYIQSSVMVLYALQFCPQTGLIITIIKLLNVYHLFLSKAAWCVQSP